jgi:signal transduction histidine kinase
MTERVAAAGGVLAAGPLAEGGWSVRATLPLAAMTEGRAA